MKLNRVTIFTATLLLAGALQGCAAVLVGGAATGVAVIHDRRTAGIILDDQNIELKVMQLKYGDKGLSEHASLSITSYNLAALLTGQAETAELRDRYVAMVRSIDRVKRVINEIQVGPKNTLKGKSDDAFITSKVKLELLNIKTDGFDPTRVKVVTEQKIVYLMGLLTHAEADAVVEKVRFVQGIKKVVKILEYL